MKRYLQLLKDIVLRPFTTEIVYTLMLWLTISGYLLFYHLCNGSYHYCLYLALLAYVIAVIISLIVNANKYVAIVFKPLLLLVIIFLLILNVFCSTLFSTHLSVDILSIIWNTNKQEAYEFLSVYISPLQTVSTIIGLAIVFIIVYRVKWHLRGKLVAVPICLFFLGVLAICHNKKIIVAEFNSVDLWKFTYDEIVDLSHHATNPKIVETDSIHPANIVIILGESFTRRHSSLYDYTKCTNPLLSKFIDDGNMVIFKNVNSPKTHTTASFKYILNTYTLPDTTEKKWYDHTNAIEVFNILGYKTIWISNQSKNGIWSNLPGGHSKICDLAIFSQPKNNMYDEVLIDALNPSDTTANNCIFYHLMGQHNKFSHRFPPEFEHFKATDYLEYPEYQRQILANYDNATRYNDYVVAEIINKYKDDDTIVFYFPDHGIDLYVSDPNSISHALPTPESQKVGKEIPFVVFISDRLNQRKPELKTEIMRRSEDPLCTDHFIYLLLDLTGYALKEG